MAKFTTYFSGLTQDTDPQGDSDFIMTYDTSTAGIKKVLITDFGFLTSGLSTDTKLDDLAAPDDNTDLDATASAHGLLMKLSGDSDTYLNGDGEWTEPAGGSGTSYDYILIQDQKSKNTAGGTATSGSWQTHVINTEVVDTGSNVSLASNQMTLAAGTYVARGYMTAYRTGYTGLKLINISDTDDLTSPYFIYASANVEIETRIPIEGYFTIADTKTIEVQYRCSVTSNTYGLGNPSNIATETYLSLWLTKVA